MARNYYQNAGFTLIEVLVSMVVLGVGLLGLASLQLLALRQSQDAYAMQQATLLATSMQAHIRASSGVDWSTIAPSAAASCTKSNPCNKNQLAADDYGEWTREAKVNLGTSASVTIQLSHSVNIAPCTSTLTTALCLVTSWTRTDVKTAGAFAKNATFYLEVIPS